MDPGLIALVPITLLPCRFADTLVRLVRICRVQQSLARSLSCCTLRVTLRHVACTPFQPLAPGDKGAKGPDLVGFSATSRAATTAAPPFEHSVATLSCRPCHHI